MLSTCPFAAAAPNHLNAAMTSTVDGDEAVGPGGVLVHKREPVGRFGGPRPAVRRGQAPHGRGGIGSRQAGAGEAARGQFEEGGIVRRSPGRDARSHGRVLVVVAGEDAPPAACPRSPDGRGRRIASTSTPQRRARYLTARVSFFSNPLLFFPVFASSPSQFPSLPPTPFARSRRRFLSPPPLRRPSKAPVIPMQEAHAQLPRRIPPPERCGVVDRERRVQIYNAAMTSRWLTGSSGCR
jgi:hypothetical protein